ncbi:AAA family ATPase [Desulfopila aestuarii]|uniref:RecA-family ATPase n=1 Tax=Desulfopila aestuarii DSM 18488 TaxID=1121416 RepID=A0A1M7YGI7_9BACT|nr:AAA family ATPase [Desulfopila aestuarii]SHO51745.1 RecA-family ATPase [Desulfopila aestuarii DSM 18488]
MTLLLRSKIESKKNNDNNSTFLHVRAYRKIGLHPIPLLAGEKRPAVTAWQHLDHGPYQFHENNNCGLLTGIPTPIGHFCVIDLDLAGNDPVSSALRRAIISTFEVEFGPSLMVDTGGNHRGRHIWVFLDEPITQKVQVGIDLHHLDSKGHYGIEILCQGGHGGYNAVAPPSFVLDLYRFVDNIDLENLGDHIRKVQKSELLKFIDSKMVKILLALGTISSILYKSYRDKDIDGELIDYALAHYVIGVLNLQDESLWHLAFEMAFGGNYGHDRTAYLLERTIQRLEEGSEMIGMGSVVEKLETESQKLLLQSLERIETLCGVRAEITPQRVNLEDVTSEQEKPDHSNSTSTSPSSMFLFEDDMQIVEREEWLIPNVVPACKFILMHGPAGNGKTTASVLIADRVITETGLPVIYLNLEGKAGDINEKRQLMTIQPELFRVVRPATQFSLYNEKHLHELLVFLNNINAIGKPAAMVIIDSLLAATAGDLNQGAVGGAAMFFNTVTATLGCTVLLLHHNNKGEGKGQARIFGSALIPGAAVMTWEIKEMDDCYFARKLVVSKSNLRAMQVGDEIIVGQYPGSAPVLFRSEGGYETDKASMTQVDRCRDILLEQLIDGRERLADDVRAAFADHDFTESTISRASKQLCIVKKQVDGKRYWSIPKGSLLSRLCRAGKA